MAEAPDRIDYDQLQAEHPSWRLFQAHPALGLEEVEDDVVGAVSPDQLGLRWLALPLAEQQAREADFLRGLLEIATQDERARFEAFPVRKGESEEIAERTGGRILDDGAVIGPLTVQAIDAFVAVPRHVHVDRCEELALMVNGPRTIGVWVDRWKVEELERELEAAWWERAQERERARAGQDVELRRRHAVDRELRARVMLVWNRRGGLLAIAAILLAEWKDWRPLGAVGTTVAIGVVALVVLMTVDSLIERWYRRAAQRG